MCFKHKLTCEFYVTKFKLEELIIMKLLSLILMSVFLNSGAFAFFPTAGTKADSVKFKEKTKPLALDGVQNLTDTQAASFAAFKAKSSHSWQIAYSPVTKIPRLLYGGDKAVLPSQNESGVRQFLTENKELLGVDPSQLVLEKKITSPIGLTHYLFKQVSNSVEVFNSKVKVHVDKNGALVMYSASYAPSVPSGAVPTISKVQAQSSVNSYNSGLASAAQDLVYYPNPQTGEVTLSHRVYSSKDGYMYIVDASSGNVLYRYSTRAYANVSLTVYDTYPKPETTYDKSRGTIQVGCPECYVRVYNGTNILPITTGYDGNYTLPGGSQDMVAVLQGPYFSVGNMQGKSTIYVASGAECSDADLPSALESDHPYIQGKLYEQTYTFPGNNFFVAPYFLGRDAGGSRGFLVGEVDEGGGLVNDDQVHTLDSNGTQVGSFGGDRLLDFITPPLLGNTISLKLKSRVQDDTSRSGYTVTRACVLPATIPGTPLTEDKFSVLITSHTNFASYPPDVDSLGEPNVYYHLSEIRTFMNRLNGTNSVDLNAHINAMTRFHGYPDHAPGTYYGVINAFYDSVNKNMMFGDGIENQNTGEFDTFAQDGTIARHEYLHAVVDRIYPLIYAGEGGAISEALSDYFALSSMNLGDTNMTPKMNSTGDFFVQSFGNIYTEVRYLDCFSGVNACAKYPDHWVGEVHYDSPIVSQALWALRHPGSSNFIGMMNPGSYGVTASMPRADVYVWNSLFFFPDSFSEFVIALKTVASKIDGATYLTQLNSVFDTHGLNSSLTPPAGADIYEPNNGPATATNIQVGESISATIYPAYDVDFYSVALSTGLVSIKVKRPPSSFQGEYHVILPRLYDMNTSILAQEVEPNISNPSDWNACPETGECRSVNEYAYVTYNVTEPNRYIIEVAAGPNRFGYNAVGNSTQEYVLTVEQGNPYTSDAQVTAKAFENDVVEFTSPLNFFYYDGNSTIISTMTARVETFEYAIFRDNDMKVLAQARTPDPGAPQGDNLLALDGTITYNEETGKMVGSVKIQPGFYSRYPFAATAHVEIYARLRSGALVSMGISDAFNLTSSPSNGKVKVWNNLLNPNRGENAYIVLNVNEPGNVKIQLLTIDGILVRDVFNGYLGQGSKTITFNGRNNSGKMLAPGMFLLKTKGGGIDDLQKIVVIR